jgi:peptidoglycan/LPS O-acetylase OafA/YrhL
MNGSHSHLPGFDALRGVAALAVAVLHGSYIFGVPGLVPHGYLAVDFFFMMSGFVLAHAYEDRLRKGLSARRLMRSRLYRLYPMVALGVCVGLFAACEAGVPWRAFISDAIAGALLVPQPLSTSALGTLFPIDPPLWSLFWEMIASATLAIFLYRIPTRLLMLSQAAAFGAIVYFAVRYGTLEVGFEWRNIGGGAARISFSFLTGLLLFRRWKGKSGTSDPASIAALAAVLGLLLLMPIDMPRTLYDVFVAAVGFPLLLMAAARVPHASAPWRTGAALSYPLYVVHVPILELLQSWKATHSAFGASAAVLSGVALSLAAAWLGHHLWDVPVRRWLGAQGRREPSFSHLKHQSGSLAT